MVDIDIIKSTGATFTPEKLAKFIARGILNLLDANKLKSKIYKVLDPSCGDGSLLEAIRAEAIRIGINIDLYGFDINDDYLKSAKENIKGDVTLYSQDFLLKKESDLFSQYGNIDKLKNRFDIIIANPPYVRTQILGANYSNELAKQFNLKGKVDLYHAFIIRMTESLKEGGLIGFITSNKFISNKSGANIRCFLTQNFKISQVHDLGDTKLFDAAVLPAIVFGVKEKKAINSQSKFTKIYQYFNKVNEGELMHKSTVYEILNCKQEGYYRIKNDVYCKSKGKLVFVHNKDCNWSLLSKSEAKWVAQIENKSDKIVKDIFKVRVGIKSTADKVFIRDNWEGLDIKVEDKILVDLISQENIDSYHLQESKTQKVIYPYDLNSAKRKLYDISDFPEAYKYFEEHKEILSSRKYLVDSGRKWYELWVPQKPNLWIQPKLVFPDISDKPRFYLDFSGKIVNGNCYWITASNELETDYLYLIQAVANSSILTKYHDLVFMNKLYSGRRRYMTQYVERYPLPPLESDVSKSIIRLSRRISNSSKENDTLILKVDQLLNEFYFN